MAPETDPTGSAATILALREQTAMTDRQTEVRTDKVIFRGHYAPKKIAWNIG